MNLIYQTADLNDDYHQILFLAFLIEKSVVLFSLNLNPIFLFLLALAHQNFL